MASVFGVELLLSLPFAGVVLVVLLIVALDDEAGRGGVDGCAWRSREAEKKIE